MDLRNKRFLVIGGAGLIGSHTIDELIKKKFPKFASMTIFLEAARKTLPKL